MQSNTGNQSNEPFVKRFEMAVMQFVILNKAQQGEVTRDNLQQTFRGNLQMSGNHFDHCINQLVQDGHLKEVGGNKFTITDDGREDVQKLQNLVLELPNVAGKQGGQQKQTATAGYGGATTGNVGGTSGQNIGQPKGGPGQSSTTGNVGSQNKGNF